jgi:hypothetical protein
MFSFQKFCLLTIVRADLTTALLTDRKPFFFTDGISWEPYISKRQNNARDSFPKYFAGLDIKLCNVWADLSGFTRSANLAFQTGKKMDCVVFQEILISILYRLFLIDASTSSFGKALHLGMLAFSTNIFLQSQGLVMPFEKLSAQLRDSLRDLQDLEDGSLIDFKLWLLFVARMFNVTEYRDSWLEPEIKRTLEVLKLVSWQNVRDKLKEYLWIGVLHDDSGKKSFGAAFLNPSQSLDGCGSIS